MNRFDPRLANFQPRQTTRTHGHQQNPIHNDGPTVPDGNVGQQTNAQTTEHARQFRTDIERTSFEQTSSAVSQLVDPRASEPASETTGSAYLEAVISRGDLRDFATLDDATLASASTSQKAHLLARAVGQRFNIWHQCGFTKLVGEPDLNPLISRVLHTIDTVDQLHELSAKVGNRRMRKFFRRGANQILGSTIANRITGRIQPGDFSKYGEFLENLTGSKPHSATKAKLLLDKEVLPSLLEDINNAKESIDVQLFEVSNDDVSGQAIDALIKKAKEGVQVRVVLDSYGSQNNNEGYKTMFNRLRAGGVDLKVKSASMLRDHLDHRKIWVFDGKVGYTGGANLGRHYHGEWRDQQTRMEGGTVPQLEKLFRGAWARVGGESGKFDDQVRAQSHDGDGTVTAHVVHHHGGGQDENIKSAYLRAIQTAEKSIHIANPYFADKDIIDALCDAAERGVNVEVVIPRDNDSQLLLDAARLHYDVMGKSGIEVREYPGMAHHKVAVFDDKVATLGSSNLDTRSLENNDEANVFISDDDFALNVREQFFDVRRAESPLIEDGTELAPKAVVYKYALKQAMTLL